MTTILKDWILSVSKKIDTLTMDKISETNVCQTSRFPRSMLSRFAQKISLWFAPYEFNDSRNKVHNTGTVYPSNFYQYYSGVFQYIPFTIVAFCVGHYNEDKHFARHVTLNVFNRSKSLLVLQAFLMLFK